MDVTYKTKLFYGSCFNRIKVMSRLKGSECQRFARRNGLRHVTSLEIRRPGNREGEKPLRFDVPANNVSSRHKDESPGRRRARLHKGNTLRRSLLVQEIAQRWAYSSRDQIWISGEGVIAWIFYQDCANVSLSTGNINSNYPMAWFGF